MSILLLEGVAVGESRRTGTLSKVARAAGVTWEVSASNSCLGDAVEHLLSWFSCNLAMFPASHIR